MKKLFILLLCGMLTGVLGLYAGEATAADCCCVKPASVAVGCCVPESIPAQPVEEDDCPCSVNDDDAAPLVPFTLPRVDRPVEPLPVRVGHADFIACDSLSANEEARAHFGEACIIAPGRSVPTYINHCALLA